MTGGFSGDERVSRSLERDTHTQYLWEFAPRTPTTSGSAQRTRSRVVLS